MVQIGFLEVLVPLLGPATNHATRVSVFPNVHIAHFGVVSLFERAVLGRCLLFVLAHTYAKIACFLIMRHAAAK